MPEWIRAEGTWDIAQDHFTQNWDDGISRCYTIMEYSSFIASFKMRMLTHQLPHPGETKFIYSGADQGEQFRLDFIYETVSYCRVSVGQLQMAFLVQLAYDQEYAVKVTLKDNLLTVLVDNMPIIRDLSLGRRSDGHLGIGTWKATATFSDIVITPFTSYNCFVVMPFDEKRDLLYDSVLKPTLETHPSLVLQFARADKSLTAGRISEEITNFIKGADIIIADITLHNPNVFYELGFAHACARKAILLREIPGDDTPKVPFDIQDFRYHEFVPISTN